MWNHYLVLTSTVLIFIEVECQQYGQGYMMGGGGYMGGGRHMGGVRPGYPGGYGYGSPRQPSWNEWMRHDQGPMNGPADTMDCAEVKSLFNKFMSMYMRGDLDNMEGKKCDPDVMRTDPNSLKSCLASMTAAASRLTSSSNLVPTGSDLPVYMSITSRSMRQSIQACCGIICDPGSEYNWQPLDGPQVWNYVLREPPNVEFMMESGTQVSQSDMYTLMLLDISAFDPGYWAHWVVSNIPGSRVTDGTELVPFFPPAVNNTHVMVLYRQTSQVPANIDMTRYGQIGHPDPRFNPFCPPPGRCLFNVAQFINDFGLTLMGINWVTPTEDHTWAYYARLNELNIPDYQVCQDVAGVIISGTSVTCNSNTRLQCPGNPPMLKSCDPGIMRTNPNSLRSCLSKMTTTASRLTSGSNLVPTGSDLPVYMSITSRSMRQSIQACCGIICDPGSEYNWQPLDGPQVWNYVLREPPNVEFIMEPGTQVSQSDMYTLMLLDISVFDGGFWAHWVKSNIPGSRVTDGTEVVPFAPPAVNNTHVMVLYKQTSRVPANIDVSRYGQIGHPNPRLNSFCPPPGRCLFNVPLFINDFGLTLMSVNWVIPKEDPTWGYFVRSRGTPEYQVCQDVPGVIISGTSVTCNSNTRLQCPGM